MSPYKEGGFSSEDLEGVVKSLPNRHTIIFAAKKAFPKGLTPDNSDSSGLICPNKEGEDKNLLNVGFDFPSRDGSGGVGKKREPKLNGEVREAKEDPFSFNPHFLKAPFGSVVPGEIEFVTST